MSRTKKITVRLNDIESKAVRETASKSQISMSEYIRNLLIKGLQDNPECSSGGTTTPPLHQ